jgi:hypothetical protein
MNSVAMPLHTLCMYSINTTRITGTSSCLFAESRVLGRDGTCAAANPPRGAPQTKQLRQSQWQFRRFDRGRGAICRRVAFGAPPSRLGEVGRERGRQERPSVLPRRGRGANGPGAEVPGLGAARATVTGRCRQRLKGAGEAAARGPGEARKAAAVAGIPAICTATIDQSRSPGTIG